MKLKKTAIGCIIHDHIDGGVIAKCVPQLDNMGVVNGSVNLYFSLDNQQLSLFKVGSQIYVNEGIPMILIAYFLRVPL